MPSQNKNFVIVDSKIYELFKNISVMFIDLVWKEEVTEFNLDFVADAEEKIGYFR